MRKINQKYLQEIENSLKEMKEITKEIKNEIKIMEKTTERIKRDFKNIKLDFEIYKTKESKIEYIEENDKTVGYLTKYFEIKNVDLDLTLFPSYIRKRNRKLSMW